MKKVSIIVPVYNSEKIVFDFINHIMKQDYKYFEVIIVDDGSIDNTFKICKSLEKEYKNLKVYNQKNQGPSSARKKGFKLSSGDFILFIDSDDFIDKNYISEIVKNYKKDYLNGASYKIISNKYTKVINRNNSLGNNMFVDIFNQNVGGYMWGYLFEKNKIKEKYFDSNTNYMEDSLFLMNYCTNVKGIYFHNNIFYYYQVNPFSLSKSNERIKSNILDINYVYNKIMKFYYKHDINLNINSSKIYNIHSQLFGVKKYKELKSILNNSEVKNSILSIKDNKLSLIYSFVLKFKLYFILFLFYKLRSCIKHLYYFMKGSV